MEVGQKVYLAPYSKVTQFRRAGDVVEGVLTLAGRKYYTVLVNYTAYRFDKETLVEVSKYSPSYRLYFDKREILDEQERTVLINKFKKLFTGSSAARSALTLGQLRCIDAVIKETEVHSDAE